ncbi:hypothetical protein HDU86_001240 [Geranomyces michiganensis]|nr:hypothetical protein HDU86_001240 [Geranomyces michiganensis]
MAPQPPSYEVIRTRRYAAWTAFLSQEFSIKTFLATNQYQAGLEISAKMHLEDAVGHIKQRFDKDPRLRHDRQLQAYLEALEADCLSVQADSHPDFNSYFMLEREKLDLRVQARQRHVHSGKRILAEVQMETEPATPMFKRIKTRSRPAAIESSTRSFFPTDPGETLSHSESDSTITSVDSAEDVCESSDLSIAWLKAALVESKGRTWKISGVDVVSKMRKLQGDLKARLHKSPQNVSFESTDEFLLTRSCLLLSESRRPCYSDTFTANEWRQMRGFFKKRLLKPDSRHERWIKAQAESMISAKLDDVGWVSVPREMSNKCDARRSGVLSQLFMQLDTLPPTDGLHESTWCTRYVSPLFNLLADPSMEWKYDSTTAYASLLRPDYYVSVRDKDIDLLDCEVKSPFARTSEKQKDLARVLDHTMQRLKADLSKYNFKRTACKLALHLQPVDKRLKALDLGRSALRQPSSIAMIQRGGLSDFCPLAVHGVEGEIYEVGQEHAVVSTLLMADALMNRVRELKIENLSGLQLRTQTRRPSVLPPPTPDKEAAKNHKKNARTQK